MRKKLAPKCSSSVLRHDGYPPAETWKGYRKGYKRQVALLKRNIRSG